jgi:multiple sugar transport system substrate-binding protein
VESEIRRRSVLSGLSALLACPALAKVPTAATIKAAREIAGSREISLNLLVPTGTGKSLDVIIEAFSRETGIQIVKTESPVDSINTDLMLDHLSTDHKFDIALPATYGILDLVQAGAIRPVTTYIKSHEPAGFRKGILYKPGDRVGNETYGYQTDGDAYLMFYNNSFLHQQSAQNTFEDRFGYSLEIPGTWGELDRQMAFFHDPENGKFGGLLYRNAGYVAWEWWVRFHAKGYWPLSSNLTPQIDSDAGVAALEDMIVASQFLDPDTSHLNIFENWKRFALGNSYCNIGWGGSQKFFQAEGSLIKSQISYGSTPGGIIDGELIEVPYFNWGWTYVVTSSSEFPEIGYLFNLFASSPEISTMAIQQTDGFFDPFRPEHYDDPIIQNAYTSEFLDVHRKSLENSIPDFYLYRQGEYFQILGEWIHRAITGEVKPKRALQAAAQRWEAISASVGFIEQRQKWLELKSSYPPNLQSKLRDIA